MDQVTTTTVRLAGVTGHLELVHGHLELVHGETVADRRAGIVVLGPDGRSMPEARDRLYAGISFPVKSSCSRSMPVGVRVPMQSQVRQTHIGREAWRFGSAAATGSVASLPLLTPSYQ
jgi:hypothetical protein